jgi:hypothetical protein
VQTIQHPGRFQGPPPNRGPRTRVGLLTFVVGLYVFPLGIELFVVPALAFVVLTHAVAVQQKEFRDVAKLLNGFLVAFGFALLAYAATQAAGDPRRLIAAATWEQLALPIVLTLVFVPFALAVSRYARWDSDRVRRRVLRDHRPGLVPSLAAGGQRNAPG